MAFSKEEMAQLTAGLIKDGEIANLGIGMPTLVADYLGDRPVMLHSENGLLGLGPYPLAHQVDAQIINAGKETVTIKKGGSTFDSSLSFSMIRGGHIDVAVLGGMEVSVFGDLANWSVPGKKITGMGGAMDLARGAKKIIVMMQHSDKEGRSKLVKNCSLPLTAKGVVDIVITDKGIFYVDKSRGIFNVMKLASSVSLHDLGELSLFEGSL